MTKIMMTTLFFSPITVLRYVVFQVLIFAIVLTHSLDLYHPGDVYNIVSLLCMYLDEICFSLYLFNVKTCFGAISRLLLKDCVFR